MKYVTGIFVLIVLLITQRAVFAQDTIHVEAGWNMIGAKSTMLQSGFASEPEGIITSSYYGYKSGIGYFPADTLAEGKGFWVKASQAGILITELMNEPPVAPYNPFPESSATSVAPSTILVWSCNDPDNDPLTYDVYFGTDNPPSTKVSAGQTNANIIQGGLSYSTVYNWSILARDSHDDSVSSPVWQFTTRPEFVNHPPNEPSDPLPINSSAEVSTSPVLAWYCSDPDDNPITYDVYFGTDNPPSAKVSSGQMNANFSPSGLSFSTVYYWSVVARDSHNDSTSGPVWQFTTSEAIVNCGEVVQYGGRGYNTVQIGSQCWFQQNLDIGTMITGTTEQTDNATLEKYCFDDNPANCTTYGALYEWDETMQFDTTEGGQGICPAGWHVPTEAQILALKSAVSDDGNALKAIGQGSDDGAGTNTSGFSALLAGFRPNIGPFSSLGYYAFFMSSTQSDSESAYIFSLGASVGGIYTYPNYKTYGSSVRCLKD